MGGEDYDNVDDGVGNASKRDDGDIISGGQGLKKSS